MLSKTKKDSQKTGINGFVKPVGNGLCLLLLLLATGVTFAQPNSSKGTEFWVGFMDNLNSSDPSPPISIHLYISSDEAATGKIEIPLTAYSQDFTVPAGGLIDIVIPTINCLVTSSETAEPKGIRVTADKLITVYALNHKNTSSDAAIILPERALGSAYMAMSYPAFDAENPSQILIVATVDNSQLQITASSATIGGACAYVPITCGFCDHLFQKMTPLSVLGRQFISIPLATRNGDEFRILAAEDNTAISLNGSSGFILNAGEYADTLLITSSMISADKSIAMAQYSRGGTCDGMLDSDPFMILMNPVEQSIKEITFNSFSSSLITSYYLNILIRTSDISTVKLDGTTLASTSLNPVPASPDYTYRQIN
ncbi:MAG: hypothetical protein ACI959_000086 [Limisphaerales bacterium]|jgi:hypothetical protein